MPDQAEWDVMRILVDRLCRKGETAPLRRSERGGVSIEYALLGACIGLGLVAALYNFKSGMNTNYDRVSLSLQRVNADTSGTRKEVSRDGQSSFMSNGVLINQVYIHYDDGSTAMLQTSPTPNAWGFQSISFDLGKDGVIHAALSTRADGSTNSPTFETVRPGVVNVTYTDGASTRSYLQQTVDLGGGYIGYRQTMNSTNIAGDWSSGYSIVYAGPDSSGNYVEYNVGSTTTYPNGQTITSGDLSRMR